MGQGAAGALGGCFDQDQTLGVPTGHAGRSGASDAGPSGMRKADRSTLGASHMHMTTRLCERMWAGERAGRWGMVWGAISRYPRPFAAPHTFKQGEGSQWLVASQVKCDVEYNANALPEGPTGPIVSHSRNPTLRYFTFYCRVG
jgi:hypothetical protein